MGPLQSGVESPEYFNKWTVLPVLYMETFSAHELNHNKMRDPVVISQVCIEIRVYPVCRDFASSDNEDRRGTGSSILASGHSASFRSADHSEGGVASQRAYGTRLNWIHSVCTNSQKLQRQERASVYSRNRSPVTTTLLLIDCGWLEMKIHLSSGRQKKTA